MTISNRHRLGLLWIVIVRKRGPKGPRAFFSGFEADYRICICLKAYISIIALLLRVVCVFCVIANVIDSRLGLSRVTTC
jgi:hypothetical protein